MTKAFLTNDKGKFAVICSSMELPQVISGELLSSEAGTQHILMHNYYKHLTYKPIILLYNNTAYKFSLPMLFAGSSYLLSIISFIQQMLSIDSLE